jgi:hypothetical protein
VAICQEELKKIPKPKSFQHYTLPIATGLKIISLIPFSNKFKLTESRASLFISPKKYTHYVHIDWMAPISLNYGIDIPNDMCVTNLYDKKDIEDNFKVTSDIPWNSAKLPIEEFNKNIRLPKKSFIHKQNEVVILNTSIYHNFDNSNSEKDRTILTLRLSNPKKYGNYENIKKIIFGS